jgi:hypothetical protein
MKRKSKSHKQYGHDAMLARKGALSNEKESEHSNTKENGDVVPGHKETTTPSNQLDLKLPARPNTARDTTKTHHTKKKRKRAKGVNSLNVKKSVDKLTYEDTGNSIVFRDLEGMEIEFRVSQMGLIDEYFDGTPVAKFMSDLEINIHLLSIDDGDEKIYVRRVDYVRVFTWFKVIDTACNIKYTCVDKHDVLQAIPSGLEFLFVDELEQRIIKCMVCAHIRCAPVLCESAFCVACVPPVNHNLWTTLSSSDTTIPLSVRSAFLSNKAKVSSLRTKIPLSAQDAFLSNKNWTYESQPLCKERPKTSAPVRVILPGHSLWNKKVKSLKYDISSMSEKDVENELKKYSSTVGMEPTKAAKMIALLSHRKASMDLRYENIEVATGT